MLGCRFSVEVNKGCVFVEAILCNLCAKRTFFFGERVFSAGRDSWREATVIFVQVGCPAAHLFITASS